MIRLDKFLSSQLNITRSEAKRLIADRRVRLDRPVRLKAELQIDPERDRVFVDGKEIPYKKYLYIMLNKPSGYVSSTDDAGPIVLDLLPGEYRRTGIFPAGRLDKDTTGFMLLTDDGAFAHAILSPARHVKKTYLVTLERAVTESEQNEIETGMELDGKRLKPAVLSLVDSANNVYRIVLTEGRYHQIKRMFAARKNRVVRLHRIGMGNLFLDDSLEPGACRELSPSELLLLAEKTP